MECKYANKDIRGYLLEAGDVLHSGNDNALSTGSHHQTLMRDESSFNRVKSLALLFLGLKPTSNFKQKITLYLTHYRGAGTL